jgi:capsular polysaccharide biosynthesis protein
VGLQEYVRILRARWITVCAVAAVAVLTAVLVSVFTPPTYAASTRLFVSTSGGSSVTDVYQGNRLSQDRVASYTHLITGETVAQRTIDTMGLDMTAQELRKNVKATTEVGTVLIDVSCSCP